MKITHPRPGRPGVCVWRVCFVLVNFYMIVGENLTALVGFRSLESHALLAVGQGDVGCRKHPRKFLDDGGYGSPCRIESIRHGDFGFHEGNVGNIPLGSPVVASPVVPALAFLLRHTCLSARVFPVEHVIRLRNHIVKREDRIA